MEGGLSKSRTTIFVTKQSRCEFRSANTWVLLEEQGILYSWAIRRGYLGCGFFFSLKSNISIGTTKELGLFLCLFSYFY